MSIVFPFKTIFSAIERYLREKKAILPSYNVVPLLLS